MTGRVDQEGDGFSEQTLKVLKISFIIINDCIFLCAYFSPKNNLKTSIKKPEEVFGENIRNFYAKKDFSRELYTLLRTYFDAIRRKNPKSEKLFC